MGSGFWSGRYAAAARSRGTTVSGWLMVVTAAGAVVCTLSGFTPYPPLIAETALAGASALCAVWWVAASFRARRPRPISLVKARPARRPGRLLRNLLAFGVPFATVAAVVVAAVGNSTEGRRVELYDRAGWDRHEVAVVRLAGEPVQTPRSDDGDAYWNTDVVVRVPFEDGPRDLLLKAAETRRAPEPGMAVEAYYAPAHPELGVGRDGTGWTRSGLMVFGIVFLFAAPWPFVAAGHIKSEATPAVFQRLRRFAPATHLPALGILLTGLVLLLPVALDFQVAGHDRAPAALAVLAPPLAVIWIAKRSWEHRPGH